MGSQLDVFSVHAVKAGDVGAVEVIFTDESEACEYAAERSTNPRVQATSVTRFTVGMLGTRTPIAWFLRGTEQPPGSARPVALYHPADGHPAHG